MRLSSSAKRSAEVVSSRQVAALQGECTKIARFSAVAAAIVTAPPQNGATFKV